MAMTITDGGIISAETAEDLAGKEGYAAIVNGSELIALADAGEDETDTVVGVITSISGAFTSSDNVQVATIQVSGTAYVYTGEAVTAGAWLTCDVTGGSADWMLAAAGQTPAKFPKAIALHAAGTTELVQATLLGSTAAGRG